MPGSWWRAKAFAVLFALHAAIVSINYCAVTVSRKHNNGRKSATEHRRRLSPFDRDPKTVEQASRPQSFVSHDGPLLVDKVRCTPSRRNLPDGWCFDDEQMPRYFGVRGLESDGTLAYHTHAGYNRCLANKNILFIGDSRVRYQYMHLASYLKSGGTFMRCSDTSPVSDEECYLIHEKMYSHRLGSDGWKEWYQNTTEMLNEEGLQTSICDCDRPLDSFPSFTHENRFTTTRTPYGDINLIYLQSYQDLIRIHRGFPPFGGGPGFTESPCVPGYCESVDDAYVGNLTSTLDTLIPLLGVTHAFVNLGWEHLYPFPSQSELSCDLLDVQTRHPGVTINLISHPPQRKRRNTKPPAYDSLKCGVDVLDRTSPTYKVPKRWYWDENHVLGVLNREYNQLLVNKVCPDMMLLPDVVSRRALSLFDPKTVQPRQVERNDILNAPTEQEFPYPLTCNRNDLREFLFSKNLENVLGEKSFRLSLVYHVGMVKNWQNIVHDQLRTLVQCGLLRIADEFLFTFSNGSEQELMRFVHRLIGDEYAQKIAVKKSGGKPWEATAMNLIHQRCQEDTSPKTSIVFYFHNKGCSRWKADWRDNTKESFTYAYSLYWRKYLEWYTLERPQLCLDRLLLGDSTVCGPNFRQGNNKTIPNHYSGNFWAARCEHVQNLKPLTSRKYTAGELWIGTYAGKQAKLTLHSKKLYRELILPSEYTGSAMDDQPAVTRLEFVHITKTGGTSIEYAAAQHGVAWGHCKFSRARGCAVLTSSGDEAKVTNLWKCSLRTKIWHCPPSMLRTQSSSNRGNFYEGSRTFAVVRNPYERIISEYYWANRNQLNIEGAEDLSSGPYRLNRWVQKHLGMVKKQGVCFAGHCIPTHVFTHDSNGVQVIDHLLDFNNLEEDFRDLMATYNLNIELGPREMVTSGTKLGVGSLTAETIALINQWAALDFQYFGYDMIQL